MRRIRPTPHVGRQGKEHQQDIDQQEGGRRDGPPLPPRSSCQGMLHTLQVPRPDRVEREPRARAVPVHGQAVPPALPKLSGALLGSMVASHFEICLHRSAQSCMQAFASPCRMCGFPAVRVVLAYRNSRARLAVAGVLDRRQFARGRLNNAGVHTLTHGPQGTPAA